MQKTRQPMKLPKIITSQELKKMIDSINDKTLSGKRNKAILLVMARSGLRVSEVCSLTANDILYDDGLIYVQQGKGSKDRYTVMDNLTAQAIEAWAQVRQPGVYLFNTLSDGEQLDPRYVREMTYRTSKNAGVYIRDGQKLRPVNPHALRHYFATRALHELELSLREVQDTLGHANLSTTQVYTHVTPSKVANKYRERSGGL